LGGPGPKVFPPKRGALGGQPRGGGRKKLGAGGPTNRAGLAKGCRPKKTLGRGRLAGGAGPTKVRNPNPVFFFNGGGGAFGKLGQGRTTKELLLFCFWHLPFSLPVGFGVVEEGGGGDRIITWVHARGPKVPKRALENGVVHLPALPASYRVYPPPFFQLVRGGPEGEGGDEAEKVGGGPPHGGGFSAALCAGATGRVPDSAAFGFFQKKRGGETTLSWAKGVARNPGGASGAGQGRRGAVDPHHTGRGPQGGWPGTGGPPPPGGGGGGAGPTPPPPPKRGTTS